jgi:hypothetical protein
MSFFLFQVIIILYDKIIYNNIKQKTYNNLS